MRAALLCDVDQSVYHVGDEAIARAATEALSSRGIDVIPISRREKHGPEHRAPERSIPALTVPWPVPDRARYLREIRAVLAGDAGALPPEDKLFGIIEDLRDVDVLVIGGGGSLNSRFGWLLTERLATALVARSVGARVVLSGQSLGPDLSAADAELLGELLDLCELVGVRDPDSLALARRLRPAHPALHAMVDDAIGLGALDPAPESAEDLISVTIGSDTDAFPDHDVERVMAAAIDGLARRTGARIELVPHMADPDTGGSDLAMHARIAELLESPAQVVPLERDELAAARAARAAYVLTTRFHPVIFGLLGGARILPIRMNRYGRSRMDGALRNAGAADGVIPLAALWDPAAQGPSALLDPVLDALVAAPAPDPARAAELRALSRAWWDHLVAVLERRAEPGERPTAEPPGPGAGAELWPAEVTAALAPYRAAVETAPVTPAVSIIMRTKDRALLLERAIQDVLAQTRSDWELVVVNDGGDPAPVDAILAAHATELAGRARALHHERSLGMEAASNAGLGASGAPLVAVHDDDDTWGATFLQQTIAHLEQHPEQAGVAVRTEIVHEHLTDGDVAEDERFALWPRMRSLRLEDFLAINRIVPISLLYRRAVHEEVGGYREDLPVLGDYDFHLRLLQRHELGFLDLPLAQWRLRPRADGDAGNSMFVAAGEHDHYDGVLREELFRPWAREHGIGLPMVIARMVREQTDRGIERADERAAQAEERAAARQEELREALAEMTARLEETRHEVGRLQESADAALARLERPRRGVPSMVRAAARRGRDALSRATRR